MLGKFFFTSNFLARVPSILSIKNAKPNQRNAFAWSLLITEINEKKPAIIPKPVNK